MVISVREWYAELPACIQTCIQQHASFYKAIIVTKSQTKVWLVANGCGGLITFTICLGMGGSLQ